MNKEKRNQISMLATTMLVNLLDLREEDLKYWSNNPSEFGDVLKQLDRRFELAKVATPFCTLFSSDARTNGEGFLDSLLKEGHEIDEEVCFLLRSSRSIFGESRETRLFTTTPLKLLSSKFRLRKYSYEKIMRGIADAELRLCSNDTAGLFLDSTKCTELYESGFQGSMYFISIHMIGQDKDPKIFVVRFSDHERPKLEAQTVMYSQQIFNEDDILVFSK